MQNLKILGFDIGIASIGWAFVEGSELKSCGVRIFTKAENQKTWASLALPRRDARGVRQRLNRHKTRLNALKKLICKELNLNSKIILVAMVNYQKPINAIKAQKAPMDCEP